MMRTFKIKLSTQIDEKSTELEQFHDQKEFNIPVEYLRSIIMLIEKHIDEEKDKGLMLCLQCGSPNIFVYVHDPVIQCKDCGHRSGDKKYWLKIRKVFDQIHNITEAKEMNKCMGCGEEFEVSERRGTYLINPDERDRYCISCLVTRTAKIEKDDRLHCGNCGSFDLSLILTSNEVACRTCNKTTSDPNFYKKGLEQLHREMEADK